MTYLWVKALHVVFMVAWFAGLFYLPRLFVYHTKHRDKPELAAAFQEMERKLMRMIMDPAMTLTAIFGIWMLVMSPGFLKQGWLHAKLTGVVILIGYHVFLGISRRRLARGEFFLQEKTWRIVNEIPTLLLLAVVVLVMVKPF
jgi:protoporphyrinogen IX oxidase